MTETGFILLRLFRRGLNDPVERLIAYLLAHRVRNIERIDDREHIAPAHRPRFRERHRKHAHEGEPHEQRDRPAHTREPAATRMMHPPEPRRKGEQRERPYPRESKDAAPFEDENDDEEEEEEDKQRRNRKPRHLLARGRHELAIDAIGKRK
jgi:hypothetical protein